ncbi:MAG: YdcF family protein [Propionibacteriaceae bacterium]|jgi:uncharacterized SAM-binding protein YcdF (DUF218 family)|nr:YdcF family protein [Propionibacteriaceae bacterium]
MRWLRAVVAVVAGVCLLVGGAAPASADDVDIFGDDNPYVDAPKTAVLGAPTAASSINWSSIYGRIIYYQAHKKTSDRDALIRAVKANDPFVGSLWERFVAEWSAIKFSTTDPTPPESGHAYVLLTSALKADGTISTKLKRRADVAVKLLKANPNSLVLVSGGKPKNGHTEAQVGRDYLISKGIAADRIWTEEKSASTVGEARYSIPILKTMGITTYTLISDYSHLRRACALYYAQHVVTETADGEVLPFKLIGATAYLDVNGHNSATAIANHVSILMGVQKYYEAAGKTLKTLTKKTATVVNLTTGKDTRKYAPKFEDELSARMSGWSPSPVFLMYQWLRSGKAIAGATDPTYTLTAADVGKTISVKVTGVKDGYKVASTTSKATKKIAAKKLPTQPTPVITSDPAKDALLEIDQGEWDPGVERWTYQWYRSGKAIKGATKATYQTTKSDYKKSITVKVTGYRPGYAAASRTSAKAKIGVLQTVKPVMVGKFSVGETLTCDPGIWGPGEVQTSCAWYRSGKKIAAGDEYVLQKADKGKYISVKATGARDGYYSATATSKSKKVS